MATPMTWGGPGPSKGAIYLESLDPLAASHGTETKELPSGDFWAQLLQNESLCSASHASELPDVWNIRLRASV